MTIFPDGGDRYLSERSGTSAPSGPALGLADVEAAIRQHAEAAYPHECCGALLGSRARRRATKRCRSTTHTGESGAGGFSSRRRTIGRPRRAPTRRRRLLGFYHSHPDHPAEPSQFDLDHAWPNLSYVIVSVRDGQDRELRSWRLRPDRSRFDEETVTQRSPTWP